MFLQIIHLEKAKTKVSNRYTKGNFEKFEIAIKEETIIQSLGEMQKKDIRKISYHDSKLDYPLVQLYKIQGNLLPTVLRKYEK